MFASSYPINHHLERHYNLDFLKDYYGDDLSAMSVVLKLYLEETPQQVDEIEKCLLNNQIAGAKAATHKIKTNLAMLGIVDPAGFVNSMHLYSANDNEQEKLLMLFKLFKSEVQRAMIDIEQDFFSTQ